MEQNKMVRKYYTPEQKVKIIREHPENQVPLSELSERYQVHMNDLYRWKKQLFEGVAQIFLSKQGKYPLKRRRMSGSRRS